MNNINLRDNINLNPHFKVKFKVFTCTGFVPIGKKKCFILFLVF